MRFIFAAILALVAGTAHAQQRQDIGAWLQGQPAATSIGPTDLLFIYQGGVDKKIAGSAFSSSLLGSNNSWTGTNAFTASVTAPTATFGDNSTNVATTAFVQANAGGSLINNASPFSTLCNLQGVTAIPTWCSAITAQAPLGIVGSVLNANTAASNGLFIGGAGNGATTTTTSLGIGQLALLALTSGNGDFALGSGALQSCTTCANVIGIGVNAANLITTGSSDVAIGVSALSTATVAASSTAVGAQALAVSLGNNNSGFGSLACRDLTSGSNVTCVGQSSGRGITTGSNDLILGECTGLSATLANAIVLCDGVNNVRIDWGKTAASTMTLAGPVVSTTTIQTQLIYSAAGTALSTCNSGLEGARAAVSDATSPTFNATYASGGTVHISVYCNGTNWTTP